jgi:membrane protease YdiL (CAAX protease family)
MKQRPGQISPGEWKNGWRFLPVFGVVLPAVFWGVSALLAKGGVSAPHGIFNLLYYLIALVAVCVIFRSFLEQSLRWTFRHVSALVRGLLLGTGTVLILQLLFRPAVHLAENLNTNQFALQMELPVIPLITTVIFAPVAEETLFRGLVFGSFRKHRLLAYAVTTVLFCFLHVWRSVVSTGDLRYFLLALEYVGPSVALIVSYEQSGTIWAPIVLHAGINMRALLSVYW